MDQASRIVLLLIGVMVAVGGGLLIASLVFLEPSDPAYSIAQSAGLALPAEQEKAFYDGVITSEEREEAASRFEACAIEAGVVGFTLTLHDVGWEASFTSTPDNAVIVCEVRHFKATNVVWGAQSRSGPNPPTDPDATTTSHP